MESRTFLATITLQDKAWGGYTLVITYDYSFDPKGDTLDLAGAHALDVERETGSLGLMTAANLKLTAAPPADPLRRVDEADLSETDRSLCTKPLLLAYKYTGGDYHETVQVTRFNEVQVLDAVADRTELTSVLTDQGQLLTQSSFMVKNNDKQFQRFKLPAGAEFWSSYVNGQPARPERDGDWFLVPLPREANRDQAFAVDIVYAQQVPLKTSLFPHRLQLLAPLTDVPNTYAEWQLFAPTAQRLSGFSGNMTIAAGTTYGLHDAWQQFLSFYGNLIDNYFGAILFAFLLGLVVVLIAVASRRGMRGAVTVLVLFSILAILAAMLLPALRRAKSRAQRISAVNNLKQIGLAAKTWSLDNNSQMPPSFEAMKNQLGTEKVTIDPNTGQRFVYVGTGKDESHPEAIIAYSPSDVNGRAVLFADGSVQILSQEKFDAAMQRDAAVPRIATEGLGVSTVTTHADSAAVPQAASASQPTAVLRGFTPPQAALPSGGGIGGGVAFAPDKEKVMVSGVRPLRIEIPRAGQVFNFTKILNAGREPLTISASLMKLKVYRTLQMLFQVCAFGFGLLLLWALSLAARRSSFWMAIAAGLVLWSVTSLLTMWRLLHLAFIAGVPLVPLALILVFSWKWWARRKAAQQNIQAAPPPTLPTGAGAGTGSAVAGIILLIGCVFVGRAGSAESLPQKLPDSVSIISASYTGSVHDKVAQFDATLHLSTTATNLMVPLFNEDVALESFTIKGPAKLVREGANAGVYVSSPGDIQLDLKLAVKLGGEVSRRRLSFALPPSLASHIQLLIDEPDADVEFPSAVAFEHRTENQQTRVDAVVGPVERLDLTWTPRMKRAAEIAATVFAQNTTLFTFGNGVVSTRTRLDYQISQGELRQIRVKLPAGQRVLRVEGESLRLWELNGDVLSVELLKGAAPAYQLTVETEQLLGKLPQMLTLDTPHALDVKRETGMVGVRGNEELALAITETGNLQRIDAEEFYRAAPDQKDGLVGAFRFARPEFNLAARVDVERPSLEATAYHRIRIEAESVRLDSRLEYTIKRAGIFSLRLALPADYRVDSVTGTNLVQWTERAVDGNRILEVTLKERTLGRYVLNTVLERAYPELPKNLALAVVHPLGTEKLSGFITVSTEMGIAAKTDTADGLTEIPFNAAEAAGPNDSPAPSSGGLAYKFISPNPGPRQEWALTILTEAVDPWVRAELMNSISLSENLVSGRTQVKYEIANAPVKELRLRVPSTLNNVEVFGAQIRRRDQTNDEWRVELQSKVRGEYILTVTWELPKTAATQSVELPRLQALGVERETGFLALSARPPLQLTEATASQLVSKIDITELPAWAGRPEASTVLAYRYLRPDYKLVVDARRYDEAEVLQTLIDSARFTTVVADDGQLMTEMSLTVRNNGRQHLEIELPTGTTVWSAFVAGEPVRPSLSNGKLLLPLAREMASDAPVPVELTFVGTEPFPKHRGSVALASPRFDVPLKNARWELYLPPDYEYSSFAGSMNRVSDAVMPVEQVYSLSEYNEQTKAQALQEQEQVRYGLQSARQSLSGGNLREAVESLSRARVRGKQSPQLGEEEKDLKKVADDLRRAQSSNLVAAQNNYFYENAAKLGEVQTVPQGGVAGRAEVPAGDAFKGALDVAGLQWDKLEKAQQVSVTKVSPLRVNLPTRGIHYAFAQVLQTELRKPMTIRLHAESTKAPNWLGRITLAVGGFGLLWACIALMNYRRARNLPATA